MACSRKNVLPWNCFLPTPKSPRNLLARTLTRLASSKASPGPSGERSLSTGEPRPSRHRARPEAKQLRGASAAGAAGCAHFSRAVSELMWWLMAVFFMPCHPLTRGASPSACDARREVRGGVGCERECAGAWAQVAWPHGCAGCAAGRVALACRTPSLSLLCALSLLTSGKPVLHLLILPCSALHPASLAVQLAHAAAAPRDQSPAPTPPAASGAHLEVQPVRRHGQERRHAATPPGHTQLKLSDC